MERVAIGLAFLICLLSCGFGTDYEPQDGDLVFQTSRSSQSLAIQKATRSRYSHMGIVCLKNGEPFVLEAAEVVKLTPLDRWTARGQDGHYVVRRLANAREALTDKALRRMKAVGKKLEGKPYDLFFEWSDDRIYCSELVWKIYQRGLGLEIGKRQTIGDLDLSDPLVQAKLRERFGRSVPKNEVIISPSAMFASELLITVYENQPDTDPSDS